MMKISKNIIVVCDGNSFDILYIFCLYKTIYTLFIYLFIYLSLRTYY